MQLTHLAMAREEVAPGDGALRTCSTRPLVVSNTKSCRRSPDGASAWARTPAGNTVVSTSSTLNEGTNFCGGGGWCVVGAAQKRENVCQVCWGGGGG